MAIRPSTGALLKRTEAEPAVSKPRPSTGGLQERPPTPKMSYGLDEGGWTDDEYYDHRRKYMLGRVDEAFNKRSIESRMGSAETQIAGRKDGDSLRDDKPKIGKSMSLLRDINPVTDEDAVRVFEKIAATVNTAALASAQSILDRPVMPLLKTGVLQPLDGRKPNFSPTLSDAEKEKLKVTNKKTLLDKLFDVDTSKY